MSGFEKATEELKEAKEKAQKMTLEVGSIENENEQRQRIIADVSDRL